MAGVLILKRLLLKKETIDHSQSHTLLSYCCYTRQTMPLSNYTFSSHTVKNTSQSKEETDNVPTDKKEKVTSDIKQGFRTLIFKEIQTINTVLWLLNIL